MGSLLNHGNRRTESIGLFFFELFGSFPINLFPHLFSSFTAENEDESLKSPSLVEQKE